MTEYQTVNGWRFPAGVDVPDDTWSRGKAGGDEFYIFHWAGFVDVARQSGLEDVDVDVVATGADQEDIPYVAVRASVTIDGERFSAIGSADAPANSLEDMASTAQSRALKRAIRIALGIRRDDESPDEPSAVDSAPDDFDPEPDHALSDEADETEDTTPEPSGDADTDW